MSTKYPAKTAALSDDQFHAIARALADPRRFAILKQIAAAPDTPCSALAEHQVISPATISHHVKELTDAGLVLSERNGRYMNLSLCRPVWEAYCRRLASL